MVKGIDVSKWDGAIDWTQTSKAVDFVIIRAGYGKLTSQKDQYFERNYAACKQYGIPCGIYWYSYATSVAEARQEAEACLSIIKGKTFELPVYYDIEEKPALKLANQITPVFNGMMEKAGYKTGIYASASAFKSYFNKSLYDNKTYSIWVANYTSNPNSYYGVNNYDLWQYSSSGSTPGINKRTDMNYCYTDFSAMMNKEKVTTEEKPVTQETAALFVELNLANSLELKSYVQANVAAGQLINAEMSIDDFVRKASPNYYKVLEQLVEQARIALKLDSQAPTKNIVIKADANGKVYAKIETANVTYQVYTRNGWYRAVIDCNDTDDNGYAGLDNREIYGLAAESSKGTLKYRVHTNKNKWYDWVSKRDINDWNYGVAGVKNEMIDGVQFEITGLEGYKVMYRVSVIGDDTYLPWVTNWDDSDNGYAGVFGQGIDKIQVKIVKK